MSSPVWKNVPLGGPTLIEASAGTGKTYTLERLYLRTLLDIEGAGVENILAVTFTVAAAAELRERIRRLIRACLRGKKRPEDEAPLGEAGIHKLKAA
ncbi:MAG: UvrD-helicase domain-containing protein, partial [Spirochaetia bacterium]|nr:UvrD-helicase domain-containing protein [Spirochaetia bacterium]